MLMPFAKRLGRSLDFFLGKILLLVEFLARSCRELLGHPTPIFALVLLVSSSTLSLACPFCSALAPTLSDDLAQATAAVIASCESISAEGDGLYVCRMRVDEVIKGDAKLADSVIEVPTTKELSIKGVFWLVGFGETAIYWGSPKEASTEAVSYLRGLQTIPENEPRRLEYFLRFLQHTDELVSDDAYNEFADASLDQIIGLRDKLDRRWVVEQLRDKSVPVHRRRLCWTFLSQCGADNDICLFDETLRERRLDATFDPGMDAAISCFISLGGQRALARIEQDYLNNPDVDYLDCFAAINAIRVHGTELSVIPRERLATALRHVLQRDELADLVIADLARWEDWSAIDSVVELFEKSTIENNFIRPKAVLYLKTCPLPHAAEALSRLRELDPESVEKAEASMLFYPGLATVPVPEPAPASEPAPANDQRCSSQRNLVPPRIATKAKTVAIDNNEVESLPEPVR